MDNLDSLAEMELSNASRIIAEAAESLRRQAALQKQKEQEQLSLGFEVEEIRKRAGMGSNVGDIAISVTVAAQMLIEAATEAQKEVLFRFFLILMTLSLSLSLSSPLNLFFLACCKRSCCC
jgi:hypothetical protein